MRQQALASTDVGGSTRRKVVRQPAVQELKAELLHARRAAGIGHYFYSLPVQRYDARGIFVAVFDLWGCRHPFEILEERVRAEFG